MKILIRLWNIISSNINTLLGRSENPEKLIRLMIKKIEGTLADLRISCAEVMAENKKTGRLINESRNLAIFWSEKASLAVNKGRDGLAREALKQKKNYSKKIESLELEIRANETVIREYKEDIRLLADKLAASKEKLHIHLSRKRRTQLADRRPGISDIMHLYELENRIRCLEMDTDPISFHEAPSFKAVFEDLAMNEEIEKELKDLKLSGNKTVEI